MVDVVAIGEVLLRIELGRPLPERGSAHGSIRFDVGGTPIGVARGARAAGASVTVVGRTGTDAAAEHVRAHLAQQRLAHDLTVVDGPTGVEVEAAGSLLVDPGVASGVAATDVPRIGAAAFVLSSYTLQALPALAGAATAWRAVVGSVPAGTGANAVFVNRDEALAATRAGDPAAAADMLARSFRLVCVTLGADGALATLDGHGARVDARGRARAYGGGDAFAGAVMASLVRGSRLEAALAAGAAAAAA